MKDKYHNTETIIATGLKFSSYHNEEMLCFSDPLVIYYPENNKWQVTKNSQFYYGNVYAFLAWYDAGGPMVLKNP